MIKKKRITPIRPKLLLAPEGYRLWSLKPDVLLTHDLIMDKSDYDMAISQRDRSSYDWLVAKALEHYNSTFDDENLCIDHYQAFWAYATSYFMYYIFPIILHIYNSIGMNLNE